MHCIAGRISAEKLKDNFNSYNNFCQSVLITFILQNGPYMMNINYRIIGTSFLKVKMHLTVLSLLLSLFAVSVLTAATFNVNTFVDSHAANPASGSGFDAGGNVSLRSAIETADSIGGTNTINLPEGTYTLTLGEIKFGNKAQDLTISGAGNPVNTIILMSSTSTDRIFLINPNGTVTGVNTLIRKISFKGGSLSSDFFGGGAISAGGPGNSLKIYDCIFDGNTVPDRQGTGGAINFSGGGTLTIDSGSVFKNNQVIDPGSTGGGAVFYFLQSNVNLTGSLNIANCLFENNISAGQASVSSGGGAIGIQTQGSNNGQTFSASITGNTFINDSTLNGYGGAIIILNAFSSGNIIHINYNRFFGNQASSGSALEYINTQGSADASNNWWASNSGPESSGSKIAGTFGSGSAGTLTASTWIVLTNTAPTDTVCGNGSTTVTASFLKNSNNETLAPANLGALIGVPVAFGNALPSGSKITNAQTTIQSNGTATATYTAGPTAGPGSVDATVDSVKATASFAVYIFRSFVSIADGSWNTPSIWNHNCVPDTADTATVNTNISLAADANINKLIISSGKILNLDTNNIHIHGNFFNSGSLSGTGTVLFEGDTTQNITGVTSFPNLTLNNPVSYVSLNNNILIKGKLLLTKGDLITNSDTVFFGTAASDPFETSGNNIVGNASMLKRNIGTGTLTFLGTDITGNTDIGNISITRVTGDGGVINAIGNRSIQANWNITAGGTPPYSNRSLTLSWLNTFDNGKKFGSSDSAVVFTSSDSGSTWHRTGLPEEVSVNNPRKITVPVKYFSLWTVTDQNNPLLVQNENTIPVRYDLYQNYPNPFNPSTVIKYAIPHQSQVVLKIYDILGREVTTLVNGERQPGIYEVNFNASSLASGVYIYSLRAGNYISQKKLLLLK